MKNAESIRQIAESLKESADQVAKLTFSVLTAETTGSSTMAEAGLDLMAAQLEFMQKAVLALTEQVVSAVGGGETHSDESVFGPGELTHVKGCELGKTGIVEEEDPEEVDE